MLAKQERLHIRNKSNRIAPKIDTMGVVFFYIIFYLHGPTSHVSICIISVEKSYVKKTKI